MDPFENLELFDGPVCHGPGLGQEENGWCVYVECLDCGCRTAELPYSDEAGRLKAAEQAAMTWNIGKVIRTTPGE